MSLAAFQDAFAEALLTIELSDEKISNIPHLPQSPMLKKQFEVYRTRSRKGLRRILASAYPTVEEILGQEAFQFTSDSFFLDHPPQSVDPISICEKFAFYIESIEVNKELPHLADIASIDFGCFQSKQAIDAASVDTGIFTSLSPEQLASRKVQLHPSCFWMSSPYAIYDFWQLHHSEEAPSNFKHDAPQEVVILRIGANIRIYRASSGLVKTLDSLDDGDPLSLALQNGATAEPAFNAVATIQFLIKNNLVVSLY